MRRRLTLPDRLFPFVPGADAAEQEEPATPSAQRGAGRYGVHAHSRLPCIGEVHACLSRSCITAGQGMGVSEMPEPRSRYRRPGHGHYQNLKGSNDAAM